ncbi:MAG: membrane dipeptidase [Spirochaetales bacterium]|nr:membrane dipeptidase [Spirochaetales bacterium]
MFTLPLAGQSPLPVIDLHNDRAFYLTAARIPWQQCEKVHICAERYQNASYFFSIFRPQPPYRPGGVFLLSRERVRALTEQSHYDYVLEAIAALKATGRPITRFPDLDKGSISISIEGTHLLHKGKPPDVDELESMLVQLRDLGVSSIQLTWNYQNPYAGTNWQWHGLTPVGKELVRLLKKYDYLIDLSHASEKTVLDVHEMWPQMPLFFSHSSIKAVCNHPRNISDRVLALVKKTGGLVGINFHAPFIACKNRASYADVIKHFAYMKKKIGMDEIALGADLDGFIIPPQQMKSSLDYQALAKSMEEQGWSRLDIEKIFFQNARIFFEKIGAVKKVHSDSPRRAESKGNHLIIKK